VGIEDLRYFRQTFQKLYTLSPTQYARQHRPEPSAARRQTKKKYFDD
jgi:methylphosphotriester-DNA--protein-cysteine methyltransferase